MADQIDGKTARRGDDRDAGAGVPDVTFGDDQSRLRKGHGTSNIDTVRHFALNLCRAANDKRSIKSRKKLAGRSNHDLQSPLSADAP